MAEVKTLKGLSPSCSNCKETREKNNHRLKIESYVRNGA